MRWLLRCCGALSTAISIGLVWALARPWQDLGGLVSERLRWLENWVTLTGAVVGFTLARAAEELGSPDRPARVGRLLSALLYPVALAATGSLLVLEVRGAEEAASIVTSALVSYGAGVVHALVGLPLLQGRRPGTSAADSTEPPRDLRV
jgi:hypothetical protein